MDWSTLSLPSRTSRFSNATISQNRKAYGDATATTAGSAASWAGNRPSLFAKGWNQLTNGLKANCSPQGESLMRGFKPPLLDAQRINVLGVGVSAIDMSAAVSLV